MNAEQLRAEFLRILAETAERHTARPARLSGLHDRIAAALDGADPEETRRLQMLGAEIKAEEERYADATRVATGWVPMPRNQDGTIRTNEDVAAEKRNPAGRSRL